MEDFSINVKFTLEELNILLAATNAVIIKGTQATLVAGIIHKVTKAGDTLNKKREAVAQLTEANGNG